MQHEGALDRCTLGLRSMAVVCCALPLLVCTDALAQEDVGAAAPNLEIHASTSVILADEESALPAQSEHRRPMLRLRRLQVVEGTMLGVVTAFSAATLTGVVLATHSGTFSLFDEPSGREDRAKLRLLELGTLGGVPSTLVAGSVALRLSAELRASGVRETESGLAVGTLLGSVVPLGGGLIGTGLLSEHFYRARRSIEALGRGEFTRTRRLRIGVEPVVQLRYGLFGAKVNGTF